MAEAGLGEVGAVSAEDELPRMPHLEHSEENLRELYPPVLAPQEPDHGDPLADMDANDPLLMEGLAAARGIVRELEEHGRRRHPLGEQGAVP